MSEIKVEDREVVRWMLSEAEKDPRKAFNSHHPHYCKLCDQPVPPKEQAAHLAAHRRDLARLAALQRRTAVKRLKTVNRLRREGNA